MSLDNNKIVSKASSELFGLFMRCMKGLDSQVYEKAMNLSETERVILNSIDDNNVFHMINAHNIS